MRDLSIALVLLFAASMCGQNTTVLTGPPGPAGSPGPQGTQGFVGATGSSVTAVQFCQGYTTSYPSTFAEVGLLIDGKIYAVYWNGSAALVELPPGAYTSTSNTAPCNFTVNADGTIGH